MNVARFFELDPDVVGRWATPDFFDREEYMMIQFDMMQPDDNDLGPGRDPWTGPKR